MCVCVWGGGGGRCETSDFTKSLQVLNRFQEHLFTKSLSSIDNYRKLVTKGLKLAPFNHHVQRTAESAHAKYPAITYWTQKKVYYTTTRVTNGNNRV